MTDTESTIGERDIKKIEEYIYLGHAIRLGELNNRNYENNSYDLGCSWKTWHNSEKSEYTNLKRKVFNRCILPVITYGMETTTLTVQLVNRLRTTQWNIERITLGISLRDYMRNEEIRKRIKVDVIHRIASLKWN